MVDAAWGGDVHDRIYYPDGIVATGVATNVPPNTNVKLDLSGTNSGNGAWHAGVPEELQCPVGQSGWFDIYVFVQVAAGPAQGSPVRIAVQRDGTTIVGNSGVVVSPTGTTYLCALGFISIADGQKISLSAYSPVDGNWSTPRLSIVRRSHGMGSSLLEAEAQPA
jgi:hypothetical protein